jgi:hypothetical protein
MPLAIVKTHYAHANDMLRLASADIIPTVLLIFESMCLPDSMFLIDGRLLRTYIR